MYRETAESRVAARQPSMTVVNGKLSILPTDGAKKPAPSQVAGAAPKPSAPPVSHPALPGLRSMPPDANTFPNQEPNRARLARLPTLLPIWSTSMRSRMSVIY